MNEIQCSVCNTIVEDDYCGICGQKIGRKGTTFLSLIVDGIRDFLDVEKSVFAVMLMTLKRPNKIIENYWTGNRGYYTSPFRMLMYALGIAVIHISYVDNRILGGDISADGMGAHVAFWGIFYPILSLVSWLSFLGKKISFAKHMISILYISTTLFIILTILHDLSSIFIDDLFGPYILLFFLECVMFWNARVFEKDKNILYKITGLIIQNLVFVGVAFLILAIFYFTGSLNTDTNGY